MRPWFLAEIILAVTAWAAVGDAWGGGGVRVEHRHTGGVSIEESDDCTVLTIDVDHARHHRQTVTRETIAVDVISDGVTVTLETRSIWPDCPNDTSVTTTYPRPTDPLDGVRCLSGPGRTQVDWLVRVSYTSKTIRQIASAANRLQVRSGCGGTHLSVVAVECRDYDRDGDGDVDLRDFATEQMR